MLKLESISFSMRGQDTQDCEVKYAKMDKDSLDALAKSISSKEGQ